MSRKNRDFFREKSEFLRDRLLLLFIDIARRGLLIAYEINKMKVSYTLFGIVKSIQSKENTMIFFQLKEKDIM